MALPDDHVTLAQQAAEKRLAYCNFLLYEEEDPEPWEGEVSEPVGAYCGCDTCVVREVLDAAWPHLLEVAKTELRRMNIRPVNGVE